jgi:response regulator RpfG family c-di-GMP phosphodiesterase/tRNA A-37 threonylcarbamoyl transferase component Bud32
MTGAQRQESLEGQRPAAGAEPALLIDHPALPTAGKSFLNELVRLQLLGKSAAGLFLREHAAHLADFTDEDALGTALVQAGLLTSYQLDRVIAGSTHGLMLGNYRVLERLGAGSMGVVFLAEHVLLKRRVAVKVLPVDDDLPRAILERFYAEMRVLADLHHPNIVMAYDAGRLPGPNPNMPVLHYLVMELVSGGDIEQYVVDQGPLPIAQACDWIRQAAAGLQEAHDHHLIHRDVKPSNLLLTDQGQVKLVDFGLARQFCSNLTDPRALLGSLEFMAPEQSFDPSRISTQADIYSLGATLFWVLTGQTPYPPERSVAKMLRALQTDRPRRLKDLLPDVPDELDALVAQMLERDPNRRPAMPIAVMNALSRFAAPSAPRWQSDFALVEEGCRPVRSLEERATVLIADSQPAQRHLIRQTLTDCDCLEAESGEAALALALAQPIDLVLLDRNLGGVGGVEVCRRLRERPPRPHLKVLLLAEAAADPDLAEALAAGADDVVAKPIDARQLSSRVRYLLRIKEAQDRADRMLHNLVSTNRQLEQSLQSRDSDIRKAQDALLFAMAKMAESREGETAGHLRRMQRYCRTLGQRAAHEPGWQGIITERFLNDLERSVPLHDIGKIGLPDSLLAKPGTLDSAERALMQKHTTIGAGILDALAREYGESLGFLAVASTIVRYHHERWDGLGYPDGLAGEAIPPAARIVALADVYDALRRPRSYKPPLSHAEAVRTILEGSQGQFDPGLVRAFAAGQDEFGQIFHQIRN